MASTAKYTKYNSALDDIISIIRKSYLGKPVDEEFLSDLKSLMENKMVATGVMKTDTIPIQSDLNTELECLPLPNEILVKIFGYLDIQEISRCAQVSHQFDMISKDSSLWKSMGKLCIDGRNVPTEFLAYIIERGIPELSLLQCEILPPKVKMSQPLNLKTLSLHETHGGETLVNELLTSHPMEKIDLGNYLSLFIKSLPQIGSKLKSLNLYNGNEEKIGDLSNISLIVNTCLSLEELNISYNTLDTESMDYLCENLTPNILKLEIGSGLNDKGLNDNNIRELVKRCPKLKVLDIRSNEKVTFKGLVAISETLHFLEYLGLPESVKNELGFPVITWNNGVEQTLPYTINLSKIQALKSMKTLKELLIGNFSCSKAYQSILKKEIPHLRTNDMNFLCHSNTFQVAVADAKHFREIKFCPNCNEYDKCRNRYRGCVRN
jgi:hypothetical protein